MFNIINSIIASLISATSALVVNTNIIKFSKNEPCYKAMLFTDDNGNFVPVVTFRSPFMGKRIPHKVVNNGLTNQSVILTDDGWKPTEGVSILFIKNGKPHYTVASLTAWELNEKLSFLTSFGWMKGWSAKDAFEAISFFSALGTNDALTGDYSTIEKWSIHIDDDSILGIVHSSYFRNVFNKAMGMKKPVASKSRSIVDTSAYRK